MEGGGPASGASGAGCAGGGPAIGTMLRAALREPKLDIDVFMFVCF